MPFETGKIFEFSDSILTLTITNGKETYMLKVKPTMDASGLTLKWKNESYYASHEQAKQHIRLALKITSVSNYTSPHTVCFHVPFYPNLIVSKENIDSIMSVVDEILNSYV